MLASCETKETTAMFETTRPLWGAGRGLSRRTMCSILGSQVEGSSPNCTSSEPWAGGRASLCFGGTGEVGGHWRVGCERGMKEAELAVLC